MKQILIKIDEDTYNNFIRNRYSRADVIAIHTALVNGTPLPSKSWCNTCEFKHLESECLGCAEYDEHDNLINLRNYKKEAKNE